jgi:hypothetical protein
MIVVNMTKAIDSKDAADLKVISTIASPVIVSQKETTIDF